MGPFSEEKQTQRAMAIEKLLFENPDLNAEMRTIWKRHLDALSTSEAQYNARVKTIFQNLNGWRKQWEQ